MDLCISRYKEHEEVDLDTDTGAELRHLNVLITQTMSNE